MKSIKKVIASTLCAVILCNSNMVFAYAEFSEGDSLKGIESREIIIETQEEDLQLSDGLIFEAVTNPENIILERRIVDDESELGVTEQVLTGYIYEDQEINPFAHGVGDPVARIFTYRSGSNGLLRKGSKMGTFVSIAATVLPFVRDWSITVQGIFAVTGMAAGSNTDTQGETYISHVYKVKEAKARWSSDPDLERYYHLGYRSGIDETYRHVMSAVQNPTTKQWTTRWYDYPTAIVTTASPNYYNDSRTMAHARAVLYGGSSYIDETWW